MPTHVFLSRTWEIPSWDRCPVYLHVGFAIYRRRDVWAQIEICTPRGRWGVSVSSWRPWESGRRRITWHTHRDRFPATPSRDS